METNRRRKKTVTLKKMEIETKDQDMAARV